MKQEIRNTNGLIYKLSLLATVLSFTAQASLADDLWLGQPVYGGTGCPAGTASAVLSPDQKSLSVLFDAFSVEAGRTSRLTTARKACNIAIPVHVPQGLSISLIEVDYRGYVNAEPGSQARFNVEYFFAGQRGPSATEVFSGGFDDEFTINHDLIASAMVWSPCGQDVNLRINSSMTALSRRGANVLAMVDSADVNAGIIYQIQWRRCQ